MSIVKEVQGYEAKAQKFLEQKGYSVESIGSYNKHFEYDSCMTILVKTRLNNAIEMEMWQCILNDEHVLENLDTHETYSLAL